ncbi:hypothetical protein MKX03_016676 [Papaver bracteatum]|nr:hypothetical protein MKX03_016676 [Papaver bracteatum]
MEKLKVFDIQKLQKRVKAEVEKLQSKVASLGKQADEAKRLEGTIEELTKSLNEKTECIESLEDLNKILTVNEHRHNDELQQARKVLIQGIGESANSRSSIRVKRMGELDSKPFGNALKRKRSSSSADLVANQSVLLCNFWEQMLRDQAWHPFKITLVDGKHKELIDQKDNLLKGLKNEWGKRAYFAVVNALVEMNEYNPSGRNPVQELWNFKEKRRATVMEGVAALVHRLRKKHTPTATAITFNK